MQPVWAGHWGFATEARPLGKERETERTGSAASAGPAPHTKALGLKRAGTFPVVRSLGRWSHPSTLPQTLAERWPSQRTHIPILGGQT